MERSSRFKDKMLHRCSQPCRAAGHYHCPYCSRTVVQRLDMERHVVLCATQPHLQPAQPDLQPAQPDLQPAQPDVQPAQPDVQPAQPDLQPAQPDLQPAKPDVQPAKPAKPDLQPAQPDLQPAQPDLQPAQPDLQPAQPDVQPAKPAKPDLQPAQPDLQPAQPDVQPAQPDLQPAKPDLQPAKPAQPDLQPAQPDLQPAQPDLQCALDHSYTLSQTMHYSICEEGKGFKVERYRAQGKLFHCPLCPKYKLTQRAKLQQHLNVHMKNAIPYKDKKICKCNLNCRSTGHFHCPLCSKSIIRRKDMETHLGVCQGATEAAAPSRDNPDLPATPSPLPSPSTIPPVPKPAVPPPQPDVKVHAATSTSTPSANPSSGDAPLCTAQEPTKTFLRIKVQCPHCKLICHKKNLSMHIQRKHLKETDATVRNASSGLNFSQCEHIRSPENRMEIATEECLKEEGLSQMVDLKRHSSQTNPDLFRTEYTQTATSTLEQQQVTVYPPSGEKLKQLVHYIYKHKKLPDSLPDDLVKPRATYMTELHPIETSCAVCPGSVQLDESKLITKDARIITISGVIEHVSTYFRQCPHCHMMYRYQEWQDGLHNFDDHVIVSLELCLYLRVNLQNDVSVSKVVDSLEKLRKVTFPPRDTVLHAYLHFEALISHDYSYSCACCGYHPPAVVMGRHKKGVFNLPVSDVREVPENSTAEVDVEDFWDSKQLEMIACAFKCKVQSGFF